MTRVLIFILLLLLLNACLPATTQETLITSSETTTVVQYASTDENFANPERGFYKQLAPFWFDQQQDPLSLMSCWVYADKVFLCCASIF